MLAIKFKRIGKKHQASFRVIISEKRYKVFGRFVEDLGWMNPRTNEVKIDKEKAAYWIKVGAQPTPSVHNLLVREGVIDAKKIPVHQKPKIEAKAPESEKKQEVEPPKADIKSEETVEQPAA